MGPKLVIRPLELGKGGGVQDYPGLASHPFTWEDSVQKFDRLAAGRIDDE
jgi:hypothetical protein